MSRLIPAGWQILDLASVALFQESLSALSEIGDDQIALIWDADTVPLKKIEFEKNHKIVLYRGCEYHKPYFETIRKLLNLEKKVNYSFIAQCMPCKGKWIKSLIGAIEINGTEWEQAIVNSIDFCQASSFSEYETLGTYIKDNFNDEVQIIDNKWQRHGKGLIGSVANLRHLSWILSIRYDFISFEKWDKPFSYYEKRLKSVLRMLNQ